MIKKEDKRIGFRTQISVAIFAMKIFWYHSRPIFGLYIISSIMTAVAPILNALIIGRSFGEIAKTINGTASFSRLVMLLIAAAGVSLLSSLATSFIGYYTNGKRDFLELELSTKLMTAKSKMPLDVLELPETVTMIERAETGINSLSWYLNDLINIISKTIGIIGSGAVLFFTAPLLLLVLLPLPIFGMWAKIRQYKKFRDVWDRSRSHRIRAWHVERLFSETTSLLEVRLFNLTKTLLELWKNEKYKSIDVRRKDEKSLLVVTNITLLFEVIVGVGADIWVARGLFIGKFTIAIFEQTRQIINTFISGMSSLSGSLSDIPLGGYKVNDFRIMIMAKHPSISVGHVVSNIASIEVRDVTFSYPESKMPSLTNIHLHIQAGEHVAIVGQNGAGKTTLLRIILGVYSPQNGSVILNGDIDISGSAEYVVGRAAVVMQDFSNFDFMTIGQSVGVIDYPNYDKQKAQMALEKVGLYAHFSKQGGLDSNYGYVEDDGVKLSGGQDQRLAIARALYSPADILIMDEPTSMIDAKDEQDIVESVFDMYKDKTALLVSHKLSTVKKAHKIVVLKAGKIVEIGSHKELFVPGTAYYELFHKQAKAYTD
jgi:ATP-binding cassette, subfamily B, bacterial